MHPYRVTLSFLGREWAAIDVEVSDPEIEPHAHARLDVDGELIALSSRFGFGELRPVQVIDLEHQIAQKIHSLTDPDYARRTIWWTSNCCGLQILTCQQCADTVSARSRSDARRSGRPSRCAL